MIETMARQILIIEKENSLRANLGQHLRQKGFRVSETDQAEEAMATLSEYPGHLVLIGLEGLKRNGIVIMRMIRERFPLIKIITINSGDQLELSIESMRLGAYDDFLIPFDLDALISCIQRASGNKPSTPDAVGK